MWVWVSQRLRPGQRTLWLATLLLGILSENRLHKAQTAEAYKRLHRVDVDVLASETVEAHEDLYMVDSNVLASETVQRTTAVISRHGHFNLIRQAQAGIFYPALIRHHRLNRVYLAHTSSIVG